MNKSVFLKTYGYPLVALLHDGHAVVQNIG